MLQLTEAARKSLSRLIDRRQQSGQEPSGALGLRIAVERGGCAGMQYSLKLGTRREQDLLVEDEGDCRVFLDQDSVVFLENCTLDYRDSLHDAGFTLHNPAAARACGCGSSFEPAPGTPDAESVPEGTDQCPSSDPSHATEEPASNRPR